MCLPKNGTKALLSFDSVSDMDSSNKPAAAPGARSTVCVTGATGFIGSWLVRSLLRRGYAVHAAVRDPVKALQVLGTYEELKIFKANLSEEGSYDEAIEGCSVVFHVAASMEFSTSLDTGNLEDHVKVNILEPAVRGTLNLLQACWRAGSVKRVIFTSSISTITAKNDLGEWRSVVDESSVTPSSAVWKTKPSGWVYVLLKLLTEEKAFQYAAEKGIELVSIIPPTVGGPFLTQSIPASVQVLLSPITGDPKLYPILVAVHSRMGSIPLVHVEDICNAHIFLMELPVAEGRYICAAGSCAMPELADLLYLEYHLFSTKRFAKEFHDTIPSVISSKRLTDLGFKLKYSIKDIIKHTIACCEEHGFPKQNQGIDSDATSS